MHRGREKTVWEMEVYMSSVESRAAACSASDEGPFLSG